MKSGLRLVLFGSGSPLSTAALEALGERFPVVAVVVPGAPPIRGLRSAAGAFARWRHRSALVQLARGLGMPLLVCDRQKQERVAVYLGRLEPDLVCVASFPCLLQPALLGVSRLGAIGVHPSLLPRRRGPEPLFWTYFHDDRVAGVTVHWLDTGEDTGDLIYQEAIPLDRGRKVEDLYKDIARRGAALLVRAVSDIAAGSAGRVPQDEAVATREPLPRPGSWRIDFSTWGAERVWHFLSGLGGRHGGLLSDARGRVIPHGPVRRYVLLPQNRTPGTVQRLSDGWSVACHDGVVEVERASLARRAKTAIGSRFGRGRAANR